MCGWFSIFNSVMDVIIKKVVMPLYTAGMSNIFLGQMSTIELHFLISALLFWELKNCFFLKGHTGRSFDQNGLDRELIASTLTYNFKAIQQYTLIVNRTNNEITH